MAHFDFVTIWRLRAPLDAAWHAMHDAEHWPSWWKGPSPGQGVVKVTVIERGAPDHTGMVLDHEWRSKLPYSLRFRITITDVKPMQLITLDADGELRGTGRLAFSTEEDDASRAGAGQITVVRFDWNVATTRAWMNLIAPMARPFFRWNHGVVMDWGAACLAKRLQGELIDTIER